MTEWQPLVHAYRARRAFRIRPRRRIAITPERAFAAIVEASRPFRLGARFRAVPDVRFYSGDDLLRSPGELLPGDGDRTLAEYAARIAPRAPQFQLVVTHPLVLDFALWAEVRRHARAIFDGIGYPVLPVVSELVIGTFARTPRGFTKRLHHAPLTFVLGGALRARLWDALWQRSPNEICDFDDHPPSQVIDAEPGDAVWWPADRWHLDGAGGGVCALLRLWIPDAGSATGAMVQQLAAAQLEAQLGGSEAVPYLRATRGGQATAPRPLLRAGARLGEIVCGPTLARELAIGWAKRVSACGLEPVPATVPCVLHDSARVRRDPSTPIVRMRWRDETIWAANGHAFALRAGERALHRLVEGLASRASSVAAICDGDPSVRGALEQLAEMGALSVRGEREGRAPQRSQDDRALRSDQDSGTPQRDQDGRAPRGGRAA